MTKDELKQLFKLLTAYDQRTVGEGDVIAWGASLRDVQAADAMAAVVEFYTLHPERRAGPGDIWAACRRMVKERFASTPPPIPPRDLADDPVAEIAWKKARDREIAAGTYVPEPAPVLVRRDVRAIAGVFKQPETGEAA